MYSIILGARLIQKNALFSFSIVLILASFCSATLFLIYPYSAAFVVNPFSGYDRVAYFYTKKGITFDQQNYYLSKQKSFSKISRILNGRVSLLSGRDLDTLKVDPEFFSVFNKLSADKGTLFYRGENGEYASNSIIVSNKLLGELASSHDLLLQQDDTYIEGVNDHFKVVGVVNNFEFPIATNSWRLIAERDLMYVNETNLSFVGSLASGVSIDDARSEFIELISDIDNKYSENFIKFQKLSEFSRIGFDIDLTIISALLACLLVSGLASLTGSLFSHLLKMDKGWKISHLIGVVPSKILAAPFLYVIFISLFGVVASQLFFSVGYPLVEKYQIIKSESAPFWWSVSPTLIGNFKYVVLLIVSACAIVMSLVYLHLYGRFTKIFSTKVGRNNRAWFEVFYWGLLGLQIIVSIWIIFFIVICFLAFRSEVVESRGFSYENKIVVEISRQAQMSRQDIPIRARTFFGMQESDFSIVNWLPGSGVPSSISEYQVDGKDVHSNPLAILEISNNFFDVLEVQLIHGRKFNDFDREGGEPVVIVDQDTAKLLGGEQQALGSVITLYPTTPFLKKEFRVVGVVNNISSNSYKLKSVYIPFEQGISEVKNTKLIFKSNIGIDISAVDQMILNSPGEFYNPSSYESTIEKSGYPYLSRIYNFLPSAVLMVAMLFLGIQTITLKTMQSKNKSIAVMLSVGCTKNWIIYKTMNKFIVTFVLSGVVSYALILFSDATIWMIYISDSEKFKNGIFLLIAASLFVFLSMFIAVPMRKKLSEPVSKLLKL